MATSTFVWPGMFTFNGTNISFTFPIALPDGTAAAPSLTFASDTGLGLLKTAASTIAFVTTGGVNQFQIENGAVRIPSGSFYAIGSDVSLSRLSAGVISLPKIGSYNAVTTAGNGVPSIVAAGRVTAQSAANASISTYTVGAADGSFEVSGNMNVTASTTLVTTLTCTYTDEANTARSMILPVQSLSGSFIAAGAITGAGATVWETPVMHIRCKASTAITILTSTGTFTGVTYTAEGIIRQVA